MGKRLTRGLDRSRCERCGHQQHLHVERDGRTVCVVCDRASQTWPLLRDAARASDVLVLVLS
jgi:hypothetical protein